jgi:hypothetical protein
MRPDGRTRDDESVTVASPPPPTLHSSCPLRTNSSTCVNGRSANLMSLRPLQLRLIPANSEHRTRSPTHLRISAAVNTGQQRALHAKPYAPTHFSSHLSDRPKALNTELSNSGAANVPVTASRRTIESPARK